MKKQSFFFGAIILATSGIICKILGAVYKIPLTNILGTQGMGIYYLIFPIYAFLLTFTSSSFTMALSKYVSRVTAEGKKKLAYRIFKSSFFLLLILGFCASAILLIFSRFISSLQGVENTFVCYLIISPAIFFVSLSSSFKGYFQGLQNMIPSAIAQVVDQLFKLSTGFLLASILSAKGVVWGTIGALLGVTIAEVVTCLFFVVYFLIFKKRNKSLFNFSKSLPEENVKIKILMKSVLKEAIPFTLSSVILPMSLVIDSFLIVNVLKSMQFEKFFATSLLGVNSGIVNTLVGLPTTLSIAICMTIVPYIAHALSKKDFQGINEKAGLAIKLTLLISIFCVFIFSFFSSHIIKVLYSSSFENTYALEVASSLLSLSSINVLYLSFLQITTALLQSINKAYIPVVSLSIALIFKVFCEIFLISVPIINIGGAVISNAICYFLSCAINIFYFKKYMYVHFSFYQTIMCPLIAGGLASGVIFLSILILQTFASYVLSIILSFLLGTAIYLFLIFILKAFTAKEQHALLFFKRYKKN